MLKSIKRSLSGNLSPPRVRFALENKTTRLSASPVEGGSTVASASMTEGDTNEASTMGDDTISSASSADTMEIALDDPPGCTKGDSVDYVGVATESFRAVALSAWLVSETVSAIGTEIWHCGCNSALNTDTRRYVTADGKRDRSNNVGNTANGNQDDSRSVDSYPPSRQRRRKGPFGFFRKKNQNSDFPTTVTTSPNPPLPLQPTQKNKVAPKAPAPPKTTVVATTMTQPKPKDHSPVRAKKLLTACFVKRTSADDDLRTLETVQSRYRLDHEDLTLNGTSSVYTIRMSRVPTSEYQNLQV